VYRELEEGIALRNRVVHNSAEVLDARFASKFICLVRDLLFLFDFYLGHKWAVSRISAPFRERIGMLPP
jgi:hypothetical protein